MNEYTQVSPSDSNTWENDLALLGTNEHMYILSTNNLTLRYVARYGKAF